MADEEMSTKAGRSAEWHTLLLRLKSSVQGLLAVQCSYVWHTYGGLDRVSTDVQNILNHQLKMVPGLRGAELDYWSFVEGLRWLNPVLAPGITSLNQSTDVDRGAQWLRESLQNLNLSSQLVILLNNRAHRQQHYYDAAFLQQCDYVQAMIICLQAIEQNNASLLTEINPALLCGNLLRKKACHVRSTSLPVSTPSSAAIMIRGGALGRDHLAPPQLFSPKTDSVLTLSDEHARPYIEGSSVEKCAKAALLQVLSQSTQSVDDDADYTFYGSLSKHDPLLNVHPPPPPPAALHRPETAPPTRSLRQVPDAGADVGRRVSVAVGAGRSRTFGRQTSVPPAAAPPAANKAHVRSASDIGVPVTRGGVVREEPDGCHDEAAEHESQDCKPDGSTALQQSKSCYFRQPQKGQSLMSFLSSQDFHTCAELDKENAHFSICEALIAAMEQMKWNEATRAASLPPPPGSDEADSDAEIQQLKQRIRIRRKERLKEKVHGCCAISGEKIYAVADSASMAAAIDGVAIATPSSWTNSISPFSESPSSISPEDSSGSSDDVHDTELTEDADADRKQRGNLAALSESGLSLSLGSMYSEADINKNNADMKRSIERQESVTHSTLSSAASVSAAETVAISLLKRFSEKQLPKASELQWLVSEQDAPQALLPLPNSYPISPDDSENADLSRSDYQTRIRGNLEWAPPRQQIIFNVHTPPKRKVLLARYGYRCAGCGAKVEPGYMRRYRYCEYIGKYFCPRCHANDAVCIPARVLHKWDFTRYCVSHFARDLLGRIGGDALFNVSDINAGLYRRVRPLDEVREWRQQLCRLKPFLHSCRTGESLSEELKRMPPHWTADIHLYSMHEFLKVRDGTMSTVLRTLATKCILHVSQCQLCQAKGFICEQCNNDDDIIFPFELHKVQQCSGCRACYHVACFPADDCPKCARIDARKRKLKQEADCLEEPDEDDS